VCEGCNDVRKVPYRCKGRFCTTCSVGESEEWSRLLTEDVLQFNHRHVIFTIDEGLRDIFLLHRQLLKDLMDAASKIITDFFQKKAKVTPRIISGLHTFGSRVNFNPHVHRGVKELSPVVNRILSSAQSVSVTLNTREKSALKMVN